MSNPVPATLPGRRHQTLRRRALCASVAVASLVALSGAPWAYQTIHGFASPHELGGWIPQANAAEAPGKPPPLSQAVAGENHAVGFADIVAKVKPAVISVRVKMQQEATSSGGGPNENALPPGSPLYKFFRQFGAPNAPKRPGITGEGSGFLISPDGFAVTNNHVVDHADHVMVTTDDSKIYTAKVIGTDPSTDLALIKIDGESAFPYVKFADSKARIGDWVVAVGNPYGLGGTVTAGIVSAQGRDIGGGPYDDYIQIDAPINKGNSGGPAFNVNGEVIGVNTAIFSPTGGSIGIGFDIPADTAKAVVAQLKDKGYVLRAWIGVQVQPVTAEIADSLGMKKAEGALVAEPQPNSPAAKAGIEAGDVITNVNGAPVKGSRELARQIASMPPGTPVKVDILRNGSAKTLTVTLDKMPATHTASASPAQSGSATPELGLSVAPADRIAGASTTGLVVTGIDPSGAAAEHGLRTGDVILDVSGKSVSSAADMIEALTKARAEGKHDVLVRVKTADATKFVALPIGHG